MINESAKKHGQGGAGNGNDAGTTAADGHDKGEKAAESTQSLEVQDQ